MPKKLIWFIAAGVAGLLYVTWDAGRRIPARVTVMNQGAISIHDATIVTDKGQVEIGTLRGGESRVFTIAPTRNLEIRYRWGDEQRRWQSLDPLSAGQPLVLYVTTSGRVAPRSKLGTLDR